MKRLLTIILASAALIASASVTDYETLALKAERFYNQKEWQSAIAMYQLMLDSKPDNPAVYGKAIVASASARDTMQIGQFTRMALQNKIPFDSIFTYVRDESFALGKTDLYEKYLLGTASIHPWTKRAVDGYMTEYYLFRRDGKKMIEYATLMLKGLPDDIRFISILAQGYLLTGDSAKAVECWKRITELDGNNFEAYSYLGNYYYDCWKSNNTDINLRNMAVKYLSEAYAIKQTPYIYAKLKKINKD